MEVASLNVRGMRGDSRYSIFTWIKSKGYDMTMLQETFCTESFAKRFAKGWNGSIFHSFTNSPHSRGVCILFRKEFECKLISSHTDSQGRIILINIRVNDLEYSICNIYAPNDLGRKIAFMQEVQTFIKENAISYQNLIIGGDFNCATNAIDKANRTTDRSSLTLTKLITDLQLVDIWRKLNPEETSYTYIDPSGRGRHSRIDNILVTKNIENLTINCGISAAPAPDHKVVLLKIKLPSKMRGKGYWLLNNSVLNEESYDNGMTEILKETSDEYENHVTNALLWEYMKLQIKQYSITYCINKARSRKSRVIELEAMINEIDTYLASNKHDEVKTNERNSIKKELDEFYANKARGYQIRSRARWVEEGEKSSKYFFSLEKTRQNSNNISHLTENNSTYSEDKDILDIASNFYSRLYTSSNPDSENINEYFDNLPESRKLRDADKEMCEGYVTLDECSQALENMRNNRSPGLDGITVEFYVKFWPIVGPILVRVYNESLDNRELIESQRKAGIKLIFKKGEQDDIANYRPVSLTNVDYKLLAVVLATRIQKVIGKLVDHDQTAYIKGRYCGTNIRLVHDVIDHYKQHNKIGILLSIDFRKAFDTIEWSFLFKCLQFFNFGPIFIQWVETIYKFPCAQIKNNGYLSDTITLSRGVRQGCPVSALLFDLCAEILAIKIRNDSTLRGFDFGNEVRKVKVCQYADDIILFLNNTDEMEHSFKLVEKFGSISGLLLNKHKCEGYWIGSYRHLQENCNLYGIRWPEELKYLGVYLGYNDKTNETKNWHEKIRKVEEILAKWTKRDLSLFGKIQIIKSLAISQLTLPASTLPVPDGIIIKINKILHKFIWGSNDKVKRIKIIKNVDKGGLGMIDVESYFHAIKAKWIHRITMANPDEQSWVQIPKNIFRELELCSETLLFNFDKTVNFDMINNLPQFYKEVFVSHNLVNVTTFESFKETLASQSIWGNKFITKKVGKKKCVLYLRNWVRSGIRIINDLRLNNGLLDENFIYTKVHNKRNIYVEIATVKNALIPFRDLLQNHQNNNQVQYNESLYQSNKQMYSKLVETKTMHIDSMSDFINLFNINTTQEEMFYCKVACEKEIKLKEFNFKMLHGILSCMANLKRWRIRDTDMCDVCGITQTIKHLIFDCRYVQPLWAKINNTFNINVTFEKILGSDKLFAYNSVLTLMSFLIYKEWVILSLDNKQRGDNVSFQHFKMEVKLRVDIYRRCKRFKEWDLMLFEKIIENIASA
jgi:exonuclease III